MQSDLSHLIAILGVFAFVMGAVVGSFLNVCIYRLPLGLSINTPRRSFCPHCKTQIPWHRNIPMLSYLVLRGKCADCGGPISFRYFGVELLTALLFLGTWLKCLASGVWVLVLPFWILASLLIIASFIDIEYFIIPDEITIGGAVAGVVLGFAIPPLMGVESHLAGLLWSCAGAAMGFGALWAVVELGKKAFGKKRTVFEPAVPFAWTRHGEDAELKIGEETSLWSDYFNRDSDRLLMKCAPAVIDGKQYDEAVFDFSFNQLTAGGEVFELDKVDVISGVTSEATFPREAMGLGDVKFIAAIGAFLGCQAVFFTIMSASVFGAVVGLATIAAGKREWSARIPFGPYLALGALLWIFAGHETVHWYFHRLMAR